MQKSLSNGKSKDPRPLEETAFRGILDALLGSLDVQSKVRAFEKMAILKSCFDYFAINLFGGSWPSRCNMTEWLVPPKEIHQTIQNCEGHGDELKLKPCLPRAIHQRWLSKRNRLVLCHRFPRRQSWERQSGMAPRCSCISIDTR